MQGAGRRAALSAAAASRPAKLAGCFKSVVPLGKMSSSFTGVWCVFSISMNMQRRDCYKTCTVRTVPHESSWSLCLHPPGDQLKLARNDVVVTSAHGLRAINAGARGGGAGSKAGGSGVGCRPVQYGPGLQHRRDVRGGIPGRGTTDPECCDEGARLSRSAPEPRGTKERETARTFRRVRLPSIRREAESTPPTHVRRVRGDTE